MDVTGLNLFGESMRVDGRQEGTFKKTKKRGPNADMGQVYDPIYRDPHLSTQSSLATVFTII